MAQTYGLRSRRALAAGLLVSALGAGVAGAEDAWVRGELRLNLRTGASPTHRIVGGVKTGDQVRILKRGENWTRIRLQDGKEGWIPAGYLDPEPPPAIKLGRLESEARDLRARVDALSQDNAELARGSQESGARQSEQAAEIARLTEENTRLKAGARWPEWITGAVILSVGMAVGAIWSRMSGRRSARRIRL